jgi:AcrR family transcriptional regulator
MALSRGRRPAGSGTRETIVSTAREQFAERGYDRTTFRSVAQAAGVDPALVVHYHGSKAGLFRDALSLTRDPAPLVARLLDGPRRTIGARLAAALAALFEDPESRAILLGRVRCAASNEQAAVMVREMIAGDIVLPLARGLGVDDPERRSALVSSQLIGFVVARYILAFPALEDVDPAEALAPVLQRYLTS